MGDVVDLEATVNARTVLARALDDNLEDVVILGLSGEENFMYTNCDAEQILLVLLAAQAEILKSEDFD